MVEGVCGYVCEHTLIVCISLLLLKNSLLYVFQMTTFFIQIFD